MNTERLLHLRRSIEAQLCWALQHNGDEELVDILRSESERLSAIINASQPLAPRPSRLSVSQVASRIASALHLLGASAGRNTGKSF